jgi:hypothetical protein
LTGEASYDGVGEAVPAESGVKVARKRQFERRLRTAAEWKGLGVNGVAVPKNEELKGGVRAALSSWLSIPLEDGSHIDAGLSRSYPQSTRAYAIVEFHHAQRGARRPRRSTLRTR